MFVWPKEAIFPSCKVGGGMAKKSRVQIFIELYLIFKVPVPIKEKELHKLEYLTQPYPKWSVEVEDKSSNFDMLSPDRVG